MCGNADNSQTKYFQTVTPDRLASVWPSIRDDVAEIAEHAPDGWIPEQVFTALATNTASLHLGLIGDWLAGWMVVRVIDDFDGRRLHVWLMYAKEKNIDLFDVFGDDFDALAGQVGANKITKTRMLEQQRDCGHSPSPSLSGWDDGLGNPYMPYGDGGLGGPGGPLMSSGACFPRDQYQAER